MVISLAASVLYKRWALHDGLRRLYRLKASGQEEEFLQALDSGYIRFHFSPFTRDLMRIRYWIEKDREEQVFALASRMEEEKASDQDWIALYAELFGYCLTKGREPEAQTYKGKLDRLLKDRNDPRSTGLRQELRLMEQAYLKKDPAALRQVREMLEKAGEYEKQEPREQ